jgi:hypothetical protein
MHQRLPAILLVLLAGIAVQPVEGQSTLREQIENIVPQITEEELDTLLTTGEVSVRYGDQAEVRLAPTYQSAISRSVEALEPTIGVEALFIIDSPLPANEITVPVFQTMQAISTMEGIEYYSASRERMRTFFHESYVIDDPDNRERTPDPKVRTVPTKSTIYVFQRDSSFGKNVYELNYRANPNSMLLAMTNLTGMNYQGILPALGPGELRMHLAVRPLGDKLLFYGMSAARPGFLFGMEDRVERSFYNRLVALQNWFVDQITTR